jgi:histidinol dehydrogenase
MASKASERLLRVLKADDSDFTAAWSEVCARASERDESLQDEVRKTAERVRSGGDRALRKCIEELEGHKLSRLEVTNDEWDAACEAVDPADRAAIGKAAMRIRDFHRKRVPSSWEMREEGGGYMGQRVRPLAKVGVYADTAGVVHPSHVIMNVVPASVVEVPEIVMAAPLLEDGSLMPEVMMAARVAGVHRVFKMGGAQAIAALSYGTDAIPRVDKIVGGSDPHVCTAKGLLSHQVGIDGEGRSAEVCVVADKGATPAWIAAELIGQAERGELSSVLLITHYKGIVSRVQDQILKQLKDLPDAKIAREALLARGAAVTTKNLAQSLELADEFAPQHLVLAIEGAEVAAKTFQNAGAIFMGYYTPVAVGDYVAGPNSMLPAGGSARFASPLGVDDFLKKTSFIKFEPPKLRELGAEVMRLAELEGLHSHGTSVELRLQKIRRARREREAAREAEL